LCSGNGGSAEIFFSADFFFLPCWLFASVQRAFRSRLTRYYVCTLRDAAIASLELPRTSVRKDFSSVFLPPRATSFSLIPTAHAKSPWSRPFTSFPPPPPPFFFHVANFRASFWPRAPNFSGSLIFLFHDPTFERR